MIYDLDDNNLSSRQQRIQPGGTVVFQIQADCIAGKRLRSTPADNFTVEGRFAGVGDFVDLIADGLDVSAFAGQKKTFDVRVVADVVDDALENVRIAVKS